MYVRLRNGKFEVNKTLSRGQWGLSQDDAGRIYRNTNSSALYVDLVPTPYFARNPTQSYCQFVVAPKVAKLRAKFTSLLSAS